jgi:hypothetical protein
MRKVLNLSRLLLASLLLAPLIAAASPPLPSFKLAALSSDNQLLVFRSDSPGTTQALMISGTDTPLTGIDVRPANRKLYALSQDDMLYIVDPDSGQAKRISKLSSRFKGGTASGFDFNPQSDRLRLVATNGLNMRVRIDVGAAGFDGPLSYASSDLHSGRRPAVAAAAYTNSVPNARSTILYVIDHELDVLIQQEPPNDGVLITTGSLGVDCGAAVGFDIVTDARGTDHAFLTCRGELYRLDIRTGATQSLGKIARGTTEFVSLAVLSE